MSLFSILIAIALLLALTSWLTGYRLPIQLPKTSGRGGSIRGASGSARPRGVARDTRKQLLRLVGGNAAVAQRLVSDLQARNPGRPEQWCWEKAIYDIERDRRA